MNYVEKLDRPLTNNEVDFNIDSLATRLKQVGAEDMSLILRRDLSRPLTSREMDNNFHQLDLITQRLMYGDGPYPTLDLMFAGAELLDPRINFTRASTATYFDERGILRTAAIDEPRFACDPATGASQGLLVEGQATNLVVPSSHPNNSPSGVTIGEEQVSLGILELFSIVEDVSDGSHYTHSPSINRVAGTSYTESFYAKGAGRQIYVFSSASVWGSNTGVRFNLDTGEVELTANATARMVRVAEDVWRCEFTVTALATGSASWRYYLHNGTSFSYQGDGVSGAFVGGMQSEEGARPTSYIPTDGSQVTRIADTPIIPVGDWFNPNEGTFVVDYVYSDIDFNNPLSLNVTPSASNPRLLVRGNEDAVRMDGTNFLEVNPFLIASGLSRGDRVKAAISYDINALVARGCALGGDVQSTAIINPVVEFAYLMIGTQRTATGYLNEPIRRITYYPRALSNEQLQALTS